ncbi:hypothetical protein RRG08_042833 [Elysia crispata]|uniref:Uncharacterized protein n=1 Tax=Elysia crispata TaxID=231223 RepID=A0AAE1AI76_9GAST|nr:hypothetical protein RRG08_042833 [Elysia crispata]
MDSYFRFACTSHCMDIDSEWIIGLYMAMTCPGILLTKLVADKMGLKWAGLAAAILLNAGLFGSAWTVQVSVAGTAMLLGVLLGLAQGLSSVVAFQCVNAWAPDKAPVLMSTSTSASTVYSLLQNQIITFIVNPKNLKPDVVEGSKTFFSQKEILDRVPAALVTYAAMNLGLQLLGYLLLAQPPKPDLLPNKAVDSDKNCNKSEYGIDSAADTPIKHTHKHPSGQDCPSYGSHDVDRNRLAISDSAGHPVRTQVDISEEKQTKPSENENKQRSVKPRDVLRTPVFYAVFLFGIANVYSLTLKVNFYKQFGLLYIQDDKYLTLVGTITPIFAAASRISFGLLLNQRIINVKGTISVCLAVSCVLCSFWYFVPQVNPVLYLILIVFLAAAGSLYYVIIPAASLQIFGPAHFSTNYGLLISSLFLGGILEPFVITPLMRTLGWAWLFGSASIVSAVALVAVVCADFNIKQLGA